MADEMEELAKAIREGDRRALARGITLVESARTDHRQKADKLLEELVDPDRQALRIGLSGTPGVGKSTFIEAFGCMLIDKGLRVAVLAVDPSSARSGGSILGDKTRMERLAREPNAYIRPSPSQTHLGGVARRSRDVVALTEAAAFDVILIETVGVGQSETIVAEMSDVFVLLIAPAGGDELQGVKRGIMEIADVILVNKADGELQSVATRTVADYAGALRLLRKREGDPEGYPLAMPVSSVEGKGLPEAWSAVEDLASYRRDTGFWSARRAEQARKWFEDEVQNGLLKRLKAAPEAEAALARLGEDVASGARAPGAAAAEALASLSES